MNKEDKKEIVNIIRIILYVTPFFLGWYGIYQLGEGDWIESAYKSVQLYLMEYSVETVPLNMPTLIAKIAAPCMTAAFLISMLNILVESIQIWWRLKTTDAVAFHGDSENIDLIQKKLKKRAVVSEKPMAFQAKKHVFMFNEDVDMYHYLDRHGAEFFHDSDKELYLCSEKILRGCYKNSKIVVCNVAENCARTYWEKFPITMDETENGMVFRNEKILLIGFDNYGQRLLTQGILKNVFSDDSAIEYHICGKFSSCSDDPDIDEYASYLDTHLQLHKAVNVKKVSAANVIRDYRPRQEICENQDTVYFHEASWQKVMGRGMEFDRIIICKDLDAENMEILNELKTFFVVQNCHVKYTDNVILQELWDCKKEKIAAFGVSQDLYDPEIILKEQLFHYAKIIHARYFGTSEYGCYGSLKKENASCLNQILEDILNPETGEPFKDEKTQETILDPYTNKVPQQVKCLECVNKCLECETFKQDWGKLSNFLRYSNVAQADHMAEKVRILLKEDIRLDEPVENLSQRIRSAFEALSEEEKTALCKIEHIRWDRYHFMNNWDYRPKRNNDLRHHHLLVRFEELPEAEKRKDENTYLSLAEIFADKEKKEK